MYKRNTRKILLGIICDKWCFRDEVAGNQAKESGSMCVVLAVLPCRWCKHLPAKCYGDLHRREEVLVCRKEESKKERKEKVLVWIGLPWERVRFCTSNLMWGSWKSTFGPPKAIIRGTRGISNTDLFDLVVFPASFGNTSLRLGLCPTWW